MAVSIDISGLISGAVTNLFDSAVIIGLPTTDAPVPTFCLCEIPGERGRASARLPGNLTQAGEFKARTVIEASTMELDIVLSDIPASKDQNVFRAIQIVLNDAALLTNSVATFGAVLPNLAGLSVGYVASCLSVLNQMKNYMQPIMILGSYIPLGVLQQTTPYLSSGWYIEEMSPPHEAGKAGVALTLRLREQFTLRKSSLLGSIMSIASEVAAPNGGAMIGAILSYFKDLTTAEVTTLLQFQTPGVGVQNAVRCAGGEIAVWEYVRTDDDGNYLIKIYDGTTGTPIYKTLVYALPGRDIFCGLFSTGAIPSGDIFDAATVFYRIDYT